MLSDQLTQPASTEGKHVFLAQVEPLIQAPA